MPLAPRAGPLAGEFVVVRGAVQQRVGRCRTLTVDEVPRNTALGSTWKLVIQAHVAGGRDQVVRIARDRRQLSDLLFGDRRRHFGIGDVDQRNFGDDVHALCRSRES